MNRLVDPLQSLYYEIRAKLWPGIGPRRLQFIGRQILIGPSNSRQKSLHFSRPFFPNARRSRPRAAALDVEPPPSCTACTAAGTSVRLPYPPLPLLSPCGSSSVPVLWHPAPPARSHRVEVEPAAPLPRSRDHGDRGEFNVQPKCPIAMAE